jgi:hypothetical protein
MDIREYDVPYHVRVAIDKGADVAHSLLIHVQLLWQAMLRAREQVLFCNRR